MKIPIIYKYLIKKFHQHKSGISEIKRVMILRILGERLHVPKKERQGLINEMESLGLIKEISRYSFKILKN